MRHGGQRNDRADGRFAVVGLELPSCSDVQVLHLAGARYGYGRILFTRTSEVPLRMFGLASQIPVVFESSCLQICPIQVLWHHFRVRSVVVGALCRFARCVYRLRKQLLLTCQLVGASRS